MRRLKLIGCAVIAIFAITAIAFAGTAAALEILPTPTAESPLKFTDKAGAGRLVTLGKKEVECAKNTSKGQFTSGTLGTIEIKFEGCKDVGTKVTCTGLSDGTAGNITVKGEVHFTDGLLTKKEVAAAAVLLTETVHFTCLIVLVEVLKGGCSAGLVLANSLDKLVSSVFVAFLQTGGDPDIPEINLPTESKCQLLVRTEDKGEEEDGAIKQDTNEEELTNFEKPAKTKVTVLLDTK